MNYYKVPINQGILDINYDNLVEGIAISETEAVVVLRDSSEQRETWTSITEEQFNLCRPQVPTPPFTPEITLEEIKENQLILMEALADIYETMIGGS